MLKIQTTAEFYRYGSQHPRTLNIPKYAQLVFTRQTSRLLTAFVHFFFRLSSGSITVQFYSVLL